MTKYTMMRGSLEALKATRSLEGFEHNKSCLVRTLRKNASVYKFGKIGPLTRFPTMKQPTSNKPKFKIPPEDGSEVSPFNLHNLINARLERLKKVNYKLPAYLRPNSNALYRSKYQERPAPEDKDLNIKTDKEKDCFVLPTWAKKKIKYIKEKPAGFFDLEKNDFQHELSMFTSKEQVRTVIAMGTDKILLWLKARDALLRLEAGDKLREKMKKEDKRQAPSSEHEPHPPTITLEEKEKLMELILKQSEQLMLYDILWNNGCCNKLAKRKLKQRSRLPLISEERGPKRNECGLICSFHYTLPYWAFEELKNVMSEMKIQTTDEETVYCLLPIYRLPKMLRKGEVERRMDKGKRKILKYLNVMKKVRNVDIALPKVDESWFTPETFKEKLLQKLDAEKNRVKEIPGVEIEEDYTGEARLQRLREKINLEEKILKMELKLRMYDDYLKNSIEKMSSSNAIPVPEFEIPTCKSDIDPAYFSAIEGRPIPIPSFSKEVYLNKVKKIFLTNLINGVKDDEAAKKEQQNLREIDYYFKILDEVNYYSEAFNLFLFDNQEELMLSMRGYTCIGNILKVKEDQIKEAEQTFKVLKWTLFPLGGLLKFRRLCQTILYDLAPYHWKVEYDKEKAKLQPLADKAADEVLGHLAIFKMNLVHKQPYVCNLIIFLADTLRNLGPPANFFKTTFEVDLALNRLALENLHAFTTSMLVLKNREQLSEAKLKLEKKNRNEIKSLEAFLEEMMEKLKPKIERIKKIDKRSEKIAYHYWKTVSTNESILSAFAHIKSLFNEFVGEGVVQTEDPIEMLMALTNEIITTQMQVLEIPFQEREAIFKFIKQKEKANIANAHRSKKLKIETETLIKSLRNSYGITVGHQGHPPRFRCEHFQSGSKVKAKKNKKPVTPISRKIMKRILNLFEPTKQDDAILDTLAAFKEIREKEKIRCFFPNVRDFNESPDSDFADELSSPGTPLDTKSSDKSLLSEDLEEMDYNFHKQMEKMDESQSKKSLSETSLLVPSLTEESLPEELDD